ncbi:hypothetical protein [Azospirillum argentinense]
MIAPPEFGPTIGQLMANDSTAASGGKRQKESQNVENSAVNAGSQIFAPHHRVLRDFSSQFSLGGLLCLSKIKL